MEAPTLVLNLTNLNRAEMEASTQTLKSAILNRAEMEATTLELNLTMVSFAEMEALTQPLNLTILLLNPQEMQFADVMGASVLVVTGGLLVSCELGKAPDKYQTTTSLKEVRQEMVSKRTYMKAR